MYSNQRILVIGLLLYFCGSFVKSEDEGEWGALNGNDITWNFPDTNNGHDTIDIDEKPMGSIYYGSGDHWQKQYDDTEIEDWSGDDNEGSGYTPEDSCMRLRQQMQTRGLVGVYIPRCTGQGDFEKLQCHGSLGQCWCVDKGGREIPGTRKMSPDTPDCDNGILAPTRRPGVKSRPDPSGEQIIDLPEDNNAPAAETGDTDKEDDMDNSIDQMPGGEIEIQTLGPESNSVEGNMMSSKGEYINASVVMKQPGILAGIIGGAVIGLLCAVLLVMFIVYRMRKKDEGSYALDEPNKRSPTHHTYQRANTREFYA